MDGLAGQTIALNNDDPEYKIELSASSPADFDVALFGLDKDLKLSDEDYMKWLLCEDLDFIPKIIKNE